MAQKGSGDMPSKGSSLNPMANEEKKQEILEKLSKIFQEILWLQRELSDPFDKDFLIQKIDEFLILPKRKAALDYQRERNKAFRALRSKYQR